MIEWCKSRWHLVWNFGLHPSRAEGILFAVICVAVATVIRSLFGLMGPESSAFAPYYSATLITSLVAGGTAGSLAAALGGVVAYLLFLPPEWKIDELLVQQLTSMLQYSISSVFIVWAARSHRRLVQQLRAEETTRQLLNRELVHRIKNVLASVQAIVYHSLRNQDKVLLGEINARITALGATHDLLVKSGWQGASIREIFAQEFSPFGLSRFQLEGEDVHCPADAAIVLALIFHELTTNAVKYGALSRPEGRVSVSWVKIKRRLNVKWSEMGGPPPKAQNGKGFGTKLLKSGLKPFCGHADTRLEPAGLVCDLFLKLPDSSKDQTTSTGGEGSGMHTVVPEYGKINSNPKTLRG